MKQTRNLQIFQSACKARPALQLTDAIKTINVINVHLEKYVARHRVWRGDQAGLKKRCELTLPRAAGYAPPRDTTSAHVETIAPDSSANPREL